MSKGALNSPLEMHHSLAWLFTEYLVVDGVRCVYSVGDNGWIVHLPGGKERTLRELQLDGHEIQVPRKWRQASHG